MRADRSPGLPVRVVAGDGSGQGVAGADALILDVGAARTEDAATLLRDLSAVVVGRRQDAASGVTGETVAVLPVDGGEGTRIEVVGP